MKCTHCQHDLHTAGNCACGCQHDDNAAALAAYHAQLNGATLCEYEDCDKAAVDGSDFCAEHDAEHRANMASFDSEPPADFDPWETEREAAR